MGMWPPRGFTRSFQLMSSDRVRSHERVSLAVAWSVDPKTMEWPIQIQIDQDEPVSLPQVRLVTDPRLEPPTERLVELVKRLEHAVKQVKTKHYADAVADTALLAHGKEADADFIYNSACVHALAIAQVRQDSTLTEAEREELGERYANQAVELLRQAVAKGFNDVAHIKQDEDFDSLRQRADFQKLLGEFGK